MAFKWLATRLSSGFQVATSARALPLSRLSSGLTRLSSGLSMGPVVKPSGFSAGSVVKLSGAAAAKLSGVPLIVKRIRV